MNAARWIVLVLLSLDCVAGQPGWRDYARVLAQRTKDGRYRWIGQVATRELVHPKTHARVLLCSSVHVGEAGFFRSRDSQLRHAGVVLVEGFATNDKPMPEEARWIRRLYRAAAKVGEVSTEVEWRRRVWDERWKFADISWERMRQIFADKKNVFVSGEERASIRKVEALRVGDLSADERGRMRRLWRGRILGSIAARPRQQEVDIERERVLFEHVKAAVSSNKHKTIAVVFGAVHLYRVEPRLVSELGYRYRSSVWHDVVSYLQESKPAETPRKRSEAGSGGR